MPDDSDNRPASGQPLRLWTDDAPGARGNEPGDIPTITPFWPSDEALDEHSRPASDAAMVVFPGGGYGSLAEHEGAGYAHWLARRGIAAFVVKYRLGSNGYRHPAMLRDGLRAVRFVREHAAAWGLDPGRIGVMGSSAGGHLAATVLTLFNEGTEGSDDPVSEQSSRPDLGVLCYPVIDMTGSDITHTGSRHNLLERDGEVDTELATRLSPHLHVTSKVPPCFIFHTAEDASVPALNGIEFAASLARAEVPYALHVYQKGGHGMSLGSGCLPDGHHPWTADLELFLGDHLFVVDKA